MFAKQLLAVSFLFSVMAVAASGQTMLVPASCSVGPPTIQQPYQVQEGTPQGTQPKTSPAVDKTHEGYDSWTVTVGELRLRGEQIKFTTGQDGIRSIQLDGKAEILLGDLRASANKIDVTLTKGDAALRFFGNARFQTDNLNGTAETVELLAGKTLWMKGLEDRKVRLERTKKGNRQEIVASSLELDLRKQKVTASGDAQLDLPF